MLHDHLLFAVLALSWISIIPTNVLGIPAPERPILPDPSLELHIDDLKRGKSEESNVDVKSNVAIWAAGLPAAIWAGWIGHRHVTPQGKDWFENRYHDYDDIAEELNDPGRDQLLATTECVDTKIQTPNPGFPRSSVPKLLLFLDAHDHTISIAEYQAIEKILGDCIDHVNRQLNRALGVRDPDNLDPSTLPRRLKEADLDGWQRRRQAENPELYVHVKKKGRHARLSPENNNSAAAQSRRTLQRQAQGEGEIPRRAEDDDAGGQAGRNNDNMMSLGVAYGGLKAKTKQAAGWLGGKLDNLRKNTVALSTAAAAAAVRSAGGGGGRGGKDSRYALPAAPLLPLNGARIVAPL
ncbi:MAG: hypothetical protein M1816_007841 [Peltula sp. TS41687]|nr:MAG: hypothetical protein M1816_007841 [Peltula sp. TS41687]